MYHTNMQTNIRIFLFFYMLFVNWWDDLIKTFSINRPVWQNEIFRAARESRVVTCSFQVRQTSCPGHRCWENTGGQRAVFGRTACPLSESLKSHGDPREVSHSFSFFYRGGRILNFTEQWLRTEDRVDTGRQKEKLNETLLVSSLSDSVSVEVTTVTVTKKWRVKLRRTQRNVNINGALTVKR